MKIILSIFALFVLSSKILLADPVITFPNGTKLNWGIVKPIDSPLNAEVLISNSGDDTLLITKVQPTCGCTNAPLRKDKLAPGESTSMMVTLAVANYDGEISKSIRVFSNDPKQSEVEVILEATIKREIFVTPSAFVSFTDVKVGETSKQILTINNTSSKDISIKVGSFSPNNLVLKIRNGQIIKKGETFPLEISISPGEVGVIKGKIVLLTNNSDYPEIPIFIFGDIKPSPLFIGQ
jgi:hypothetical protein